MADEDLGNQLKIQQQINSVLAKRQKMLLDQVQTLGAQAKMAKEVCNALECKQLDGMERRLKKIEGGLKEVKTRTDELNDSLDETSKNANRASKGFFNMSNAIKGAALVGFAGGVVSAFKGAFSIISNTIKAVVTLVGAVAKLSKTILSIPFQIMEGLAKMAAKTHDMLVPVREAVQDIAREFGDLSSNEGKAVKGSMDGIQKSAKALAKAGISVGDMYGLDEKGAAARLKAFNDIAKGAGGAISLLSKELNDHSQLFDGYRRGLGLTAEQLAHVGKMSITNGKSMKQGIEEFAKAANDASRATNINAKIIGKGMGEIMSNYEEFGEMGPEAMAKNVAFARKLGIEIKGLQGMLKFDNFETAAKSASKLASAFGVNIDAMKLMRTQDPGERLKYLQQQFRKSGKSIESMGRIARKNLASALGDMDQNTLKLAFSNRGLGMSYDEIKNKIKDKKKEGQTTEQVLAKIAKNIAKVVHQMEKQFTGFFDAFSSGFLDGIFRSKEMRGMLTNLASSLRATFYAGREVAYMFMSLFPGVSDMAGALKEFFSPKNIGVLLGGIKDAFRMLFLDLQVDPNSGFDSFVTRIGNAFSKFFMQNGHLAQILKDGAKSALTALSGLTAQIINSIVPQIAEGLKHLADFLRTGSFDNLREVGGWWTDIMDPLLTSLESNLPILASSIGEFFKVAWELSKPYVSAAIDEFMKWLGIYMGAVMIFSMTKAVASAVIAGIISTMLFGGPPGMATAVTLEMATVIGSIATMAPAAIAKAAANLAIIGTVFLVAMGAVVAGVAYLIQLAGVGLTEVGTAVMAIVGISFSVALLGAAAAKIGTIPEPLVWKSVGVMAVLAVIVAKLALLSVGIAHMMQCVDMTGVVAFMGIMGTLVTSIIALATAATIIGLVVAKSMGVGAALMVVGLKTIGIVALAVTGFSIAFIAAFKAFSPSDLEKASKAADVTVKIMDTTLKTMGEMMSAGIKTAITAIVSGKDPVTAGLRALKGVTDNMLEFLPAILTSITKALEGRDPTATKLAVETVEKVMMAISPMINVTATMGQVAAGLASAQRKNPVDPSEIKEVLKVLNSGVKQVFEGVQGVITTIMSSLTELTPAQIKSAEAAAPVMQAAGSMLSAVMSPVETVLKNARDVRTVMTNEGVFTDDFDTKDFGISSVKVRQTMKALGDTLPGVMKSMGTAVTSIMNALKKFTVTDKEAAGLLKVGKVMKPVGESILSVTKAIGQLSKLISKMDSSAMGDGVKMMKNMERLLNLLTGGSWEYVDGSGTGSTQGLFAVMKSAILIFDGIELKGDAAALRAKSEAIAGTMTAIGAMTNAMGKSLKALGLNAKEGVSAVTSGQITLALTNMKSVVNGMIDSGFGKGGMLSKLMDKIYSFGDDKFGKGGIKKVKFVAKKAKLISGIVDVIPTLTSMIDQVKSMKRMLDGPQMSLGDPSIMSMDTNPIQDLWENTIKNFFESPSGSGKGPLELIVDAIDGIASKIGSPEKLGKQVDVMRKSFDAIGKISTLLQRFGIDPKSGSKSTKSAFVQALDGAHRLYALLVNPSFANVINKIKSFAGGGKMALPKTSVSKLAVKRIKGMGKVFSQIDKVLAGKSGGEFNRLVNDPNRAATLAKNITQIDETFRKAGSIQMIANVLDGGGKIIVEHQNKNVEFKIALVIDTNEIVGKLFNVASANGGKVNTSGLRYLKFTDTANKNTAK